MKNKPLWVRPFEGELLTLWLARVAIQGGTDPLVLTGEIWPKWRLWTQDADRGLTSGHLEAVADWFELPKPLIEATTLSAMSKVMQGAAFPLQSTWPWVVSMGSRNRLRKAGLPFCPECLAATDQPYFRLEWRFAWTVGCARHRVRLIDRCPKCTAPIEPHRSTASSRHLAHCIACRFDLRAANSPAVNEDALHFQILASSVLHSKVGFLGDVEVSDTIWFQRMRRIVGSPRCKLSPADSETMARRDIGLCIETQSPQERECRLRNLARLIGSNHEKLFGKVATVNSSPQPVSTLDGAGAEKCMRKPRPKAPIQRTKVQRDWARLLRRHRIW